MDEDFEIFKVGRSRIIFPPDITESELKFISTVVYSYIQATKYKETHPAIWSGEEKAPVRENKTKEQVGVS